MLALTLPYTGKYTAEVFSQDGRTGIFTFMADVQNTVTQVPQQPTSIASIPTLSEWAMIILSIIIMLIGFFYLRQSNNLS